MDLEHTSNKLFLRIHTGDISVDVLQKQAYELQQNLNIYSRVDCHYIRIKVQL